MTVCRTSGIACRVFTNAGRAMPNLCRVKPIPCRMAPVSCRTKTRACRMAPIACRLEPIPCRTKRTPCRMPPRLVERSVRYLRSPDNLLRPAGRPCDSLDKAIHLTRQASYLSRQVSHFARQAIRLTRQTSDLNRQAFVSIRHVSIFIRQTHFFVRQALALVRQASAMTDKLQASAKRRFLHPFEVAGILLPFPPTRFLLSSPRDLASVRCLHGVAAFLDGLSTHHPARVHTHRARGKKARCAIAASVSRSECLGQTRLARSSGRIHPG